MKHLVARQYEKLSRANPHGGFVGFTYEKPKKAVMAQNTQPILLNIKVVIESGQNADESVA